MIRYYESREPSLPPSTPRRGHRQYQEEDIRRLRVLRALLAAGVSSEQAVEAVHDLLPTAEREQALDRLTDLLNLTHDAIHQLRAPQPSIRAQPPAENRIGLFFDLFVARTRTESLLATVLRPVGVAAGDLGLLDLVWVEQAVRPATLARLTGTAPSTLAGRLTRLVDQGLVLRRRDPHSPHSWLVEITAEGLSRAKSAIPPVEALYVRLGAELKVEGLDLDHARDVVLGISAALRRLLPDALSTPSPPADQHGPATSTSPNDDCGTSRGLSSISTNASSRRPS